MTKPNAAEVHKHLKEQARQAMSAGSFANFLQSAKHFHRYSFNNRRLIAGAGYGESAAVNSYKRWQSLGRQVMKGEKAIYIFAPSVQKVEEPDGSEGKRVYFVFVPVFAYEQTQPIEGAAEVWQPFQFPQVQGGSPELIELIERAYIAAAVPLQYIGAEYGKEFRGVHYPETNSVQVIEGMTTAETAHVLLHELAHALHYRQPDQIQHKGAKELIADITAHAIGSDYGIDSEAHSAAYTAYYGITQDMEPDALAYFHRQLSDTIAGVAQVIDLATHPAEVEEPLAA